MTCILNLPMLGKTDLTSSHAMLYTNQWAVFVYSGFTISVCGLGISGYGKCIKHRESSDVASSPVIC